MLYQNPILGFKMGEACDIIFYYVSQCTLGKLYKVKHSLFLTHENEGNLISSLIFCAFLGR